MCQIAGDGLLSIESSLDAWHEALEGKKHSQPAKNTGILARMLRTNVATGKPRHDEAVCFLVRCIMEK